MLRSINLLVILTVAMATANTIDSEILKNRPSQLMVEAFLKYGQKSPFTKNATSDYGEAERMVEDLLAWDPPEYLKNNFPYYFAGYSYDKSPVWIIEGGKFDIAELISKGSEMVEAAEVAIEQGLARVLQTMADAAVGDEMPRVQVIVDIDGMNMKKLNNPKVIPLAIKIIRRYKSAAEFGLEHAVGINLNYFAQSMLNILRPVLGDLMERAEIYGSNKDSWMARLHRILPSKSLPPWYGGNPNFKPLAVYG